MRLTNEADMLLCSLYKEYISRRTHGVDKLRAKLFGDAEAIQESYMPKLSVADVVETCRELSRAGFAICRYADDTVIMLQLADDAIIHMENRFKNGADEVLSHIEKVKNILWPL